MEEGVSIEEARGWAANLLADRIVVGHSLTHDWKVLGIPLPPPEFVRDTARYPVLRPPTDSRKVLAFPTLRPKHGGYAGLVIDQK